MTSKGKNKGGRPRSFDALRQHLRLREMVAAAQDDMTAAQIEAAKGVKYLVARDKKGGKFKHLTAELAAAILSGEETEHEIVEQWEKPPSTQAYSDLMDRAIGRPIEQIETNVSGSLKIAWETTE